MYEDAFVKLEWISRLHGLFNTMLKGSFHKGPQWGRDDGYGLSLGVSAAGLGPPRVCSVTSFAICQHWVGTNLSLGSGQHIPGPPTTTHTSQWRQGWEVSDTHKSCSSSYPQSALNRFLLSTNHCCVLHIWLLSYPLRLFCSFGVGRNRGRQKGIEDNKNIKTKKKKNQ